MPAPLLGYGLSRSQSLSHHLAHNHYPAVDARWIPICEAAIDKAKSVVEFDGITFEVLDTSSVLDEQVGQGKTAQEVLDGLHLWDFVTHELTVEWSNAQGDFEFKGGE